AMRVFLLVSILMLLFSQSQSAQEVKDENPPVEVLSSKWSKSSQKMENPNYETTTPPPSIMTPKEREDDRNRKLNDQFGAPDPNGRTIEARSAALEQNEKEARTPKSLLVDGFIYRAKIRNAGTNTIEILFWEYQFKERANPAN